MPKVSAKRQITLPVNQCREAHINPGDDYASYVDNFGRITIVKKEKGTAQGMLGHVEGDKRISDEASLNSAIDA